MKKIVLLLTLTLCIAFTVYAADVDMVNKDGRDFLLFSSNGFQFGSYMRVGLHQNADANMVW